MPESVEQCIDLSSEAASNARKALGIAETDPLRIAFVAGPGDAVGTFDHWIMGNHDPRTPVIAYSSMFYTVVASLGAEALILVEQDKQPQIKDPHFRFVHIPRRRDRKGMGYRLDAWAFSKDVLRHLRSFRPDVIIVGTDAPDTLVARLPSARRIILTAHNTYWPMGRMPTSLKSRLKLHFTARALRRIDAAVCTSEECALQVATLGGPRGRSFVEIPQVLLDFFPETLPQHPASARRLLYLGRIEPDKGIFNLLSAFNELAADHPSLMLDFGGTGSADAELKSAIAASPHAERITFHGLLSARGVHDLLDASDLLICPTRSAFAEGLALVVIEAAVHGVPSVVSSVVPAKELVPGACAEFPADDAAALASKLRLIVEDPAEYATLCKAVASRRELFRDRSRSWGSTLFRALIS